MIEPASPQRTKIGWVGTGVMGAAMCRRLLDAGYSVALTTRTPAKAVQLVEAGAELRATAAEVAADRNVVFSMVGVPDDVREVVLGAGGILAGARPGTVVVDMTTSEPSLAVELATRAAALGVSVLDAPVSGGDVGAREGTLSIMVGGDFDAVRAVRPCLEAMGRTIVHQGSHGAGQHAKLVNQTLIAGTMVSLCEALLYAARARLDLTAVLESVSSGAASSWALQHLAPRIVDGDLAPGFFVDHFVKDMGITLAEARRMRLSMPGLALAEQLYVALQAQGHGRSGTQALVVALGALSDAGWPEA
jgi:3-hydroxyisobutyrate dehydrogenase